MPFKWHPEEPPPIIEEHSKAKLLVLRKCLRAYFDRLNVNPNREEFKLDLVDGFAGGGTFRDGDDIVSGSPLVMLEEVETARGRLNRKRNKPLRVDCKCYFVDVEQAHTDHLRRTLIERDHVVDSTEIVVLNEAFENVVDDISTSIRHRQPRAGRAIFLLDQTGFSRVELTLVARILSELPAAEVILTFAADVLTNHLAETPQIIKSVAPLQMTEAQIRDLIEQRDGSGGRALVQRTLRGHVRLMTGATFDTPFFIRPVQSRRALWFLHLSRHPTARDVMVRLHWETHNTFEHYGPGDFGMLGWDALRPNDIPLFNFEDLEAQQMQRQLLESMPKRLFGLASEEPISVEALRYAVANETAARFSDLDKTLLTLAGERKIEILNVDGKRRSRGLTRLRATDRIAFPDTLFLPGFSRLR